MNDLTTFLLTNYETILVILGLIINLIINIKKGNVKSLKEELEKMAEEIKKYGTTFSEEVDQYEWNEEKKKPVKVGKKNIQAEINSHKNECLDQILDQYLTPTGTKRNAVYGTADYGNKLEREVKKKHDLNELATSLGCPESFTDLEKVSFIETYLNHKKEAIKGDKENEKKTVEKNEQKNIQENNK